MGRAWSWDDSNFDTWSCAGFASLGFSGFPHAFPDAYKRALRLVLISIYSIN